MQIDEIRDEVNTFETFLEKALEQKYEQLLPPDFRAYFWEINLCFKKYGIFLG